MINVGDVAYEVAAADLAVDDLVFIPLPEPDALRLFRVVHLSKFQFPPREMATKRGRVVQPAWATLLVHLAVSGYSGRPLVVQLAEAERVLRFQPAKPDGSPGHKAAGGDAPVG